MSIKGFKVNNQIERYDYGSLDNLPDIDGSVMERALDVSSVATSTNNGVTFTHNQNGTWSLSGTASSSDPARKYFAYYPTSIPSWLDFTKTLFINFKASGNSKVHANVGFYYNGQTSGAESISVYEPTYVRIPDNITGIAILFFVPKGTEVTNVTINEFDIMYASGFDAVANQLKNSSSSSVIPASFARVTNDSATSILDYPKNFITTAVSTQARSLLSYVGFPDDFGLGSSNTSITIVGFSISDTATQYLVMAVNGSVVYLGFHNRSNGLNNWSDIKGIKRRIRVLNIGHSGGQDVLAYTPFVIERIAPDIEFDLGLAYLSSATIDMMYSRILDNTIKDIQFNYKGHSASSWTNSSNDKSLADILGQGPWDVILFEQATYLEGTWSSYNNLQKLIDSVTNWHRSAYGSRCKIGWIQMGPNFKRSGVTFESVIDCVHKVLRSTQVEFVIPAGTATRMNAPTNAKLAAIGNEGNMMADGHGHLQEGIPVLVGSYVSAMKLLEVCGCGNRSVEGDDFWPTDDWVRNVIHSPGQNGTCVPTGDATDSANLGVRQVAQKAAIAAIKYPERVTKIDYQQDLANWLDPYPEEESAKIDGFYPSMTVGNAEQLVSTVGIEDKVPYSFRTAGASAEIGNREADMVVGGTVVWNQLEPLNAASYTLTNTNNVSLSLSGRTYALTSKNSGNVFKNARLNCLTVGHKYFLSAILTAGENSAVIYQGENTISISSTNGKTILASGDESPTLKSTVFAANYPCFVFRLANAAASGDTVYYGDVQLFDLTKLLGSTIADYIYGLEQATNGAGVAWFKKLFPNSYYAYAAASLQSVSTSAHIMVGFNAYNNTTGKAKLIGGMQYQITGTYSALSYSTGETLTPDASGYFTPTENGELTVTGGNSTDTCVHLVLDGEKDGQFEPYVANSYTLDSSLTLRGIPKLGVDNKLYYDGDTYESDGTVTRKYGTRAYASGDESLADAITDGTDTVYKLTTFTTETADPYQNSQIVNGFGTEEYVDAGVDNSYRDVAIPVGHQTVYMENLRKKLETAPINPNEDGDYIMRRVNGRNSYIKIQNNPSENGTYTLKATVASGVITLSWVSDS